MTPAHMLHMCCTYPAHAKHNPARNWEMPVNQEERLDNAFDLRKNFASTLGAVDNDVITHLINPMFSGAPAWPAMRSAWQIIRRENGNIGILSDGLADPFDDDETPNDGFGIEMYIETSDDIGKDFDAISGSWLYGVCYDACNQAAGHGGLRNLLDQHQILSMELFNQSGDFDAISNAEGRFGVLMGVDSEQGRMSYQGLAGDVLVVPVKILTLAQLQEVVADWNNRLTLNRQFAAEGTFHINSREALINT